MNEKLREFFNYCIISFFAGMMVVLGALGNLLAIANGEKLLGSVFFSFGLFFTVLFSLKMYTGMTYNLVKFKLRDWYKLVTCFIGNALGVFFICFLASYTTLGKDITLLSQQIMANKFEVGYLNAFCSSILCGILIDVSIKSYSIAPTKGLSGSVGVMLPVIIYVYLGLDNSVANWNYIFLAKSWTSECLIYVLLTIVGNIIGGVFFSAGLKLIAKKDK